ncbi:erythrocyte binding protein [Histomonas meleagridis]|uniref:erythrocyte binding protein n=1 Tax=Histomonas meleagridis TaxID=135588 RepID=UPI003559E90E|nr:erythrocyte binding protein [Histomonas meleagridis]KAH0797323.1 erythrocyte binding protein [Histomonas meleagridis]
MDYREIIAYLSHSQCYVSQEKKFEVFQKTPIPDEYFQYIYKKFHENENPEVVSPSIFHTTLGYNGYTWTQDDDLITIKYESEYEFSISPKDDEIGRIPDEVKIEGDKISSESNWISGTFYETPQEYDIQVSGKKVTIQLHVKSKWPILIIGGDMDLNSSFLLALSAPEKPEIYERFLLYSAWRSHRPSQILLAQHLAHDRDAHFYWRCRLILEHSDLESMLVVSVLLTEFEDGTAYKVSENLLLFLAQHGITIAYHYLGMLHLADQKGFNADPKLAFKYFEKSALEYHNVKSIESLGHCYLMGIGVERDIDKGAQILESIGIDPTNFINQIKERENMEKEKEAEKEKENPNNIKETKQETKETKETLTDMLIAGALIGAAALAAGIFFYRRRK